MNPSRHVWLTPRDLRRDIGPVDGIAPRDGGASGRLHYRVHRVWLPRVTLVLAASGAGIAVAAPLLAIGAGGWFAAAAIAVGALYAAALRLALVARARDRTLAYHGQILPRLSDIRSDRVRRRPQAAALRLAHALVAPPIVDDSRDAVAVAVLRAVAPIAAGLWLAGERFELCAAALGAGLAAGALAERHRLSAAFRAEVSGAGFAHRVARFVAGWPTLRAHGAATEATVERLRRHVPIAAQRRSAFAMLRSSAVFRLAVPALAIVGMIVAAGLEPMKMIGLAVAMVAAGQAGAVLGGQAARIAQARRRLNGANRLFDPGRTAADRIERIETLTVEDLAFHYPGAAAPVFEGLDFTLARGEVLALASPSGSGKTTLLRILTGLAEPCAGRVLVNGRAETAYRHRVAAVFQDEEVGAGTIRAAIASGAGIGLDAAWDVAARVGADDLIRALPMEMQTLVVEGPFPPSLLRPLLIARALAQGADLLILDEALGALPYDRARTLLDSLRADGVLVIFASHDPTLVALADKIVALGA